MVFKKGNIPWNRDKNHPKYETYIKIVTISGHNNKDNLITLCHNCHCKTNYRREYYAWQFQVFMNLFHNIKYNVTYNIGGGKNG
jgi:hypothetical protein